MKMVLIAPQGAVERGSAEVIRAALGLQGVTTDFDCAAPDEILGVEENDRGENTNVHRLAIVASNHAVLDRLVAALAKGQSTD